MLCDGPSTYTQHMIQANAIGRSSKTVREFLEKNHKDDMSRDDTIKLTVKSLLEVVQTGAKNIEISVMESYGKVTTLELAEIEGIVAEIEREKEAGEWTPGSECDRRANVSQQRRSASGRDWQRALRGRRRCRSGWQTKGSSSNLYYHTHHFHGMLLHAQGSALVGLSLAESRIVEVIVSCRKL